MVKLSCVMSEETHPEDIIKLADEVWDSGFGELSQLEKTQKLNNLEYQLKEAQLLQKGKKLLGRLTGGKPAAATGVRPRSGSVGTPSTKAMEESDLVRQALASQRKLAPGVPVGSGQANRRRTAAGL
jgi:hypothetical protein